MSHFQQSFSLNIRLQSFHHVLPGNEHKIYFWWSDAIGLFYFYEQDVILLEREQPPTDNILLILRNL